jgi:hypothetical protein
LDYQHGPFNKKSIKQRKVAIPFTAEMDRGRGAYCGGSPLKTHAPPWLYIERHTHKTTKV